MKSELIVDVQPDELTIALLEDDRLEEINRAKREKVFAVGNIYFGRVKKIMPALNAAFVDVGHEKDAFLHYLDLGSNFLTIKKFANQVVSNKKHLVQMNKVERQPEVGKDGQIQDYLSVGDMILVQVAKEPINTKGPRLTAEISLAGRNMVLMPFAEKVMVSSKIKREAERSRLKQLIQSIKPHGFGLIVRTLAEDKRVAELDNELRLLVQRWENLVLQLQKTDHQEVSLILEEIGRTTGVIRDIFTPDFKSIHVNDEEIYKDVKAYVELIAPDCTDIVHLYQGDIPIFDQFDVTRQMKVGLGRTVGFSKGGYLIMERTEALFSIDVNSGSKKIFEDQEQNAFGYNMLAADEIAHQLRLRDIGGIIIVDFIDMESKENQQALYDHVRELMKKDRAKHNILQLSKFGLMQITRQRVRPAVEVEVSEVCPTCMGKGKIQQSSILFTETLAEQVAAFHQTFGKGLRLYVHPFVCAFCRKGLFSLAAKWRCKYGVKLLPNQALGMLQYRFLNQEGKEVILQKDEEKTSTETDS